MADTIVLTRTWTVYRIMNTVNGKSYIGVTSYSLPFRWRAHIRESILGKNWWLSAAIRKYGEEIFTISPLTVVDTRDKAMAMEKWFVAKFKSQAPFGYNMTDGGEGFWRQPRPPVSDETKAKLRAAALGRTMSPEARAKISAANRGKMTSATTKAKMSAAAKARKRRPFSREAIANIRAALVRSRSKRRAAALKFWREKRKHQPG